MKNLFTLAIILGLFSACLEKNDPKKLTNTKWELSELPGLTLPASAKATLVFGDSLKISGKSFCNSYGGKAEIADQKIVLKEVISTRMFCQETDAAERAYMQAINQVTGAKIMDKELQLLKGNEKLLVFKKID
ncbi:META domain-containing protein [Pedobacter petrophilus]|uniref:META domain-containing protein n=1 Tax=Pedobacter petrophilus TaxID=1908241 RepID=A0A7K0FXT5_9SPHI|nr:META domain-containing protein [Pedobacter petrophilus]MRX75546.1 META domain-containing protein [Pedobacter petrophilus]